eukprot:scaffold673768_cov65-Prasinocladus_malaysianus.AAC.1
MGDSDEDQRHVFQLVQSTFRSTASFDAARVEEPALRHADGPAGRRPLLPAAGLTLGAGGLPPRPGLAAAAGLAGAA